MDGESGQSVTAESGTETEFCGTGDPGRKMLSFHCDDLKPNLSAGYGKKVLKKLDTLRDVC